MSDDIVTRLLRQDSSAYMDGSHNWVLDAHPEDPEKPGRVTVHIPWQAWYLLGEAVGALREQADEIERLRAAITEHRTWHYSDEGWRPYPHDEKLWEALGEDR